MTSHLWRRSLRNTKRSSATCDGTVSKPTLLDTTRKYTSPARTAAYGFVGRSPCQSNEARPAKRTPGARGQTVKWQPCRYGGWPSLRADVCLSKWLSALCADAKRSQFTVACRSTAPTWFMTCALSTNVWSVHILGRTHTTTEHMARPPQHTANDFNVKKIPA